MVKRNISDFYMDLLKEDALSKRSSIKFRAQLNDEEQQTSLFAVVKVVPLDEQLKQVDDNMNSFLKITHRK